ncbi:MAG: hypothetical protein HY735_13745 [Verrucomicrobia bacterium]|nr:hypothetical protein [Verrucomicrobiota bacterium]
MNTSLSRRQFLAASATAFSLLPRCLRADDESSTPFPLVDCHVHLDNSTIDKVVALSKERGIKFGIVEHAGTKENRYPVVLSNDDELERYIAGLEGKTVFKGIQTEWNDWMGCFSRATLARLDYVLTDTMTFPGKDGRRVKLWEPGVEERVDMADKQKWMDRYVDWHIAIISQQPIDILANASWLPAPLAKEYDAYWTAERVQRVIDTAVKFRVALEISSSYRLPKLAFLKQAKAGGVKFSFGSNGRYPNMGKLDYSVAMAKELGLKPADLFSPAPDGQKAVQRRVY